MLYAGRANDHVASGNVIGETTGRACADDCDCIGQALDKMLCVYGELRLSMTSDGAH